MRRRLGRVRSWALPVLLAASALAPCRAAAPLTVVQETRVDLDLRLAVSGVSGGRWDAADTLSGPAGRALSAARTFDLPGEPLRVFLALTPEADEARELCRVRLVSEVRRGPRAASVRRTLDLAPERATIVDLWSAPDGARLVLALSASWAQVPRLVAVAPGSEPVEFRVQQIARQEDAQEIVDERVLAGIIGSPIRTALEHKAPTRAAAAAPPVASPRRRPVAADPPPQIPVEAGPKVPAGLSATVPPGPGPAVPPGLSATVPPGPGPSVPAEAGPGVPEKPAPEAPEGGTLLLELFPQRVIDGALVVSARVSLASGAGEGPPDPEAGTPAAREGFASARALPGESFDLRVGLGLPGHALVFRITPYF